MDLVNLAKYHRWANERTRSILTGLTWEEFTRDLIPPIGSIQNHVFHSMIAIYYKIHQRVGLDEKEYHQITEKWAKLSIPELMDEWRKVDESLILFAGDPSVEVSKVPNYFGKGEITVDHAGFFYQYLLHSTYYRGQIMSALRMMGKEGVGTDFLLYISYLESNKLEENH